jgi:hypothetical protein
VCDRGRRERKRKKRGKEDVRKKDSRQKVTDLAKLPTGSRLVDEMVVDTLKRSDADPSRDQHKHLCEEHKRKRRRREEEEQCE